MAWLGHSVRSKNETAVHHAVSQIRVVSTSFIPSHCDCALRTLEHRIETVAGQGPRLDFTHICIVSLKRENTRGQSSAQQQ